MLKEELLNKVIDSFGAIFFGYLAVCHLLDEYLAYNSLEGKAWASVYFDFARVINGFVYALGGGKWNHKIDLIVSFLVLVFLWAMCTGFALMAFNKEKQ